MIRMEARSLQGAVRPAAVAGHFYPADAGLLRTVVEGLLSDFAEAEPPARPPKALIVPHAGYVYSGAVAARAYNRLRGANGIRRVVLVGPAHRVGFYGIAAPEAAWFETPLGRVPVDQPAVEQACELSSVFRYDAAHAPEHCLEVQLPFLQRTLTEDFTLVPLVVGGATTNDMARTLEAVWGGPETLVVISSDLSHHLDYDAARIVDERTSRAIETLDEEGIEAGMACGRVPIQGLLRLARQRGLAAERLDLRCSGDTAGPRDRVVGYGAYAFGD
ncbi:AmmeMemoRadiSam system protein B [Thioalkalivibrio sulfidiphilus]|uniref:AmmeMemoRadiSam system protein B n=1 Tax=Thioalkalivibrio sulfidiphilus TaxID=1033854 RepID=UPI003BB0119A